MTPADEAGMCRCVYAAGATAMQRGTEGGLAPGDCTGERNGAKQSPINAPYTGGMTRTRAVTRKHRWNHERVEEESNGGSGRQGAVNEPVVALIRGWKRWQRGSTSTAPRSTRGSSSWSNGIGSKGGSDAGVGVGRSEAEGRAARAEIEER